MRASEMRTPPTSKPNTAARTQLMISAPDMPQASSSSGTATANSMTLSTPRNTRASWPRPKSSRLKRCSMMALMPPGVRRRLGDDALNGDVQQPDDEDAGTGRRICVTMKRPSAT